MVTASFSQQRYKVSSEILAYHYTTNEEEVDRIKQLPPHPIAKVQNFDRCLRLFSFLGGGEEEQGRKGDH